MLTFENIQLRQGIFTLTADFSTKSSEIIALIGPSGAGKSTLLNIAAGFASPTRGRILWRDQDITTIRPANRPIAMLFQDNNLFGHLTIDQNVSLGVRPNLRLGTAEKLLVAQALSRVGLDGFANRKPAQLSGGQQSRVALARVLVQQKPLMFLDEPFAALGPSLRNEMLDLVAELADEIGAMVLLVTHDPDDAIRIAPRTILVTNGTANAPCDTRDLLKNPPDALREYIGPKYTK